jgi:hypothetical protein
MKLLITIFLAIFSFIIVTLLIYFYLNNKFENSKMVMELIQVDDSNKWLSITRYKEGKKSIFPKGSAAYEKEVTSSNWDCECGKKYITNVHWNSKDRCNVYVMCLACDKGHIIDFESDYKNVLKH